MIGLLAHAVCARVCVCVCVLLFFPLMRAEADLCQLISSWNRTVPVPTIPSLEFFGPPDDLVRPHTSFPRRRLSLQIPLSFLFLFVLSKLYEERCARPTRRSHPSLSFSLRRNQVRRMAGASDGASWGPSLPVLAVFHAAPTPIPTPARRRVSKDTANTKTPRFPSARAAPIENSHRDHAVTHARRR
ncbi:hypothetical protein BJV74DRAFT_590156 [Russula compacta]|nr:hypothetical protein BJV74DRAFT_590156 [Russula compacta]